MMYYDKFSIHNPHIVYLMPEKYVYVLLLYHPILFLLILMELYHFVI